MKPLFGGQTRTDHTPARANESMYGFIDRSARPLFTEVRRLLTEWTDHVPTADRSSLVGSFQSGDNHAFGSAFWELYLHEAYLRSGYQVTIHPDVPSAASHPDFLVERDASRFYLEAVRVNVPSDKTAETRRLNEVHAVLDSIKVDKFLIHFSYYSIGPRPLPTKELRRQLTQWLSSLDPVAVTAAYALTPVHGSLPAHLYQMDGWSLEFEAVALRPESFGTGDRLVGMFGAGEAQIVDNVTGLTRVLNSKAQKYGTLDAPLVIAVMANTDYPTYDHNIEQALYGLSSARPRRASEHPKDLYSEGHWLTRKGWRRGHAPQVIAVQDLSPWSITRVQPRLWSTLEPGVSLPEQPDWLAAVSVDTPNPSLATAQSLEDLFGLPSGWLADKAF